MRIAAALCFLTLAGCTYTPRPPPVGVSDGAAGDVVAVDAATRDAPANEVPPDSSAAAEAPAAEAPAAEAPAAEAPAAEAPAAEAPAAEAPGPDPLLLAFGCPDDERLVACYTFEQGADNVIHDGSGFKHHGTTNAVRVRGGGRQGDGLRFGDSMQMGTVADRSWLRLEGDDATIEAWVRPASYAANDDVLDIIVAKVSLDPEVGYAFGVSQGKFSGYAGGDGKPRGEIPVNVWSHLAAVWTAQGMVLYHNGRSLGVFPGLSLVPGSDPLTIGNRHPSVSQPPLPSAPYFAYRGDVDVIRIFNRARTAAEICADAARRWTGTGCSEAAVIP